MLLQWLHIHIFLKHHLWVHLAHTSHVQVVVDCNEESLWIIAHELDYALLQVLIVFILLDGCEKFDRLWVVVNVSDQDSAVGVHGDDLPLAHVQWEDGLLMIVDGDWLYDWLRSLNPGHIPYFDGCVVADGDERVGIYANTWYGVVMSLEWVHLGASGETEHGDVVVVGTHSHAFLLFQHANEADTSVWHVKWTLLCVFAICHDEEFDHAIFRYY